MHRRPTALFLLLGLAGCATGLPPAPSVAPDVALIDSLPAVAVEPLTPEEAQADAEAINDLAVAAPEPTEVPEFDDESVRWDIDVQTYASHPRVRYYLDYFQGPARDRVQIFLDRGAVFEPMIRRRFETEGLPGDLGYLAMIESGYSSSAVSRAHAVGMWQFMRPTGRAYGLRVDSWMDERRDPVKALDAAARHLRDLRDRFGSLYLAAAAYNAGAGKVSRSLGKLQWDPGVDPAAADSVAEAEEEPEEELEAASEETDSAADEMPDITSDAAFFRLASSDLLAAETQDYVPKLIAAALIAKEPARYGFTVPASEPFAYDSIVVGDATGLDVAARLAGTTVAKVRELNPQYLRLATPPRTRAVIRLPAGRGGEAARRYERLPASQRVRWLSHVVRKKERLARIAARYRVSVADLRRFNPKVRGTTRPKAGTRLVIPAVAVPSALALRAAGERPAVASHRAIARKTHRVRSGDTLSGIARRYRVTVKSIQRANALGRSTAIRPGMRLRIPA